MRIELTTSSLPRKCSTPELQRRCFFSFWFSGLCKQKKLTGEHFSHNIRFNIEKNDQSTVRHLIQYWSGGRGSNSRHSAWKADTLPTELPPQFRAEMGMKVETPIAHTLILMLTLYCGGGEIRTYSAVKQQSYSLSRLSSSGAPPF
jgi:hypothetical protein